MAVTVGAVVENHSTFMAVYTRLLFLAGMWPPRSEQKRRLYNLYSLAVATFLAVNAAAELGGLFFCETLDTVSENVCSFVFRTLALCNMLTLALRARRFQKIFYTFAELVTRSHGNLDAERIKKCSVKADRFSHKFLKRMAMYFTFTSTSVVLQPVIVTILVGRSPMPFTSSAFWLFGIRGDGPVSAFIVYASQSVAQYLSTLICVTFECFVVSLSYHGACQAEALRHMLSSLQLSHADQDRDGGEDSANQPRTYHNARSQLVYCIRMHQQITRFSDDIGDFFKEIIMIQFLASLSFIATLFYQVAVVPSASKLMAASMILICSNTQVLGYCWGSTQLKAQAEEVGSALFSSSWTSAPPHLRRMIIPISMRSAKPAALWCWKFFRVELHTWIKILNKSYSFYALMRDRSS